MFARSFKELTFVTVTITVSLTSYAFVPAIFTQVTPIALISPLTIVVRDLQGQSISLLNFAFSTTPLTLTAAILFGLGAGLYREEDMFTQRAIPLKVPRSASGRIFSKWSALKLSALLLPFVFVAGSRGGRDAVRPRRSVHPAGAPRRRHHRGGGKEPPPLRRVFERAVLPVTRPALVVGALSGVGFFLAEKFVLIAQLADLQSVPTGEAAFIGSNVPEGIGPVLVAALLLAPLALHVVTARRVVARCAQGETAVRRRTAGCDGDPLRLQLRGGDHPLSKRNGRSWDPRLVVARRDLSRSRERRPSCSRAIDPPVRRGAFSSFLVVGLTSLYDPGSVEAGQIEIGVSGDQQDALFEAVQRQSGATPVGYEEPAGARAAFQRGEVDAVLTATSAPAAEGGGSVMAVSATVPDRSIRTTVVVAGPASSEDAGASGARRATGQPRTRSAAATARSEREPVLRVHLHGPHAAPSLPAAVHQRLGRRRQRHRGDRARDA